MTESDPIEIVRRHWRSFLPFWLSPVVMMVFQVIADASGKNMEHEAFLWVVTPYWFASMIPAVLAKKRLGLSNLEFLNVWCSPMFALWIVLVLIRAAILTALGRPL